jgi:hypothetical protein
MHNAVLLPGWDTAILMIPFLVVLGIGMFHLDERLADPKRATKTRRPFCGVDQNGRPFLSDPDGKLWLGRTRQIEGTLAPGRSLRND